MNEHLKTLIEVHNLLAQQIEAAQKELTPDEVAQYHERSRRIRELVEQLRETYPSERG
jgi:hypothetical protein